MMANCKIARSTTIDSCEVIPIPINISTRHVSKHIHDKLAAQSPLLPGEKTRVGHGDGRISRTVWIGTYRLPGWLGICYMVGA